ncbi:NAD-dependent epimerase/dehydratase family protein [Candidatus Falkowbacteria bacterium]|nr:NAD-dependent epimerase/dehydratase family protein [Candidatus Falkowbacteria bacterium]
MAKILITGGAGFIASHIQDAYLEKDHRVVVVDNLVTGNKKNLNSKSKFYRVDITSSEIREIIKKEKPDIINHHAAQIDVRKSVSDPVWDAKVNILGIINLLEGAKEAKVKKFIFASSGGAIYGDPEPDPSGRYGARALKIPTPETSPERPISPYGVGKLTSEKYLYYYNVQYGLEYVALRYANVYGPRQNSRGEAGVVAIFLDKLLAGETPIINGDGKQTRDYVYVGDVVKANVLALRAKTGVYNIGTGKETDVNQVAGKIVKAIGAKVKPKHGPGKPGEQKRSCIDWGLAKRILKWKPEIDVDQGIRETVAWFKHR